MTRSANINEDVFDRRFAESAGVDYRNAEGQLRRRDRQIMATFQRFGVGGRDVLDVGPGTGRWLQYLKDRGAGSLAAVGVSDVALQRARELGASVQKADLEQDPLRFADNSFDVVYSFMVLEHLRDPDLFVPEIFRVARKGALLLFSIPNLTSLQSRIRFALGYLPIAVSQDPTHVRYYTPRELPGLFGVDKDRVTVIPTSFSINPFNRKTLQIPSNRLTTGLDDHRLFRIHY